MTTHEDMNRRSFLKKGSLAAAAVAFSPRRAFGRSHDFDPVSVGVIGCGKRGSSHLGCLRRLGEAGLVNVAAVCDVLPRRLEAAVARTGAKGFTDYCRLLDLREVDAVLIAAPDDWHVPMTIAAAEAGKDVYCETPMCSGRNLREARGVVETIARFRRVMQVGTQEISDGKYEQAKQRIQAGGLGRLIRAQASVLREGAIAAWSPRANNPASAKAKMLERHLGLGPAPERSHEPGRLCAFRSLADYSGTASTGLFGRLLTPLVSVMGVTFPKRVAATPGVYRWDDGREVPGVSNLLIEYPEGPSIHLGAGLTGDAVLPMQICGQEATLTFSPSGFAIEPQQRAAGEKRQAEVAGSRPGSLDEHWKDFLDAVHTRQRPRSHEILGYHVLTALHMGARSYLEGKAIEFNAIQRPSTVMPAK